MADRCYYCDRDAICSITYRSTGRVLHACERHYRGPLMGRTAAEVRIRRA